MTKAREFVLRDLENLQRAAGQPIVGADYDSGAYGDGTDMMIAFRERAALLRPAHQT